MQAGSLRLAALAAIFPAILAAQTPAQTAAPSVQLKPYSAPDGSAQAGVPSGWNVTSGSQTVIDMSGPQGATIGLGRTYIARNAPFQAGQKGAGGADLSMPYATPLTQKLILIYQQAYALNHAAAPQITFSSATPIPVPPILGQCGRFVASLSATGQQPQKIMGAFCSLPLDTAGAYKNVLLVAQAPATAAAEDAPIAQAVFASYKMSTPMLAKKLAPVTAPPPPVLPRGAAPGMSSATYALQQSNISATCFDEGVIRGYSNRQLPQECGGEAPNP
jgi:hypothetical protein